MRAIANALIITLSLSLTSSANPILRQDIDDASLILGGSPSLIVREDDKPTPSDYPYGTAYTNEFKWVNWDPEDDEQKKAAQKIHDAFKERMDFVKEGTIVASNKDSDTFKRWFGELKDPEDPEDPKPADEIKTVFTNTHFDDIGKEARNGFAIGDEASGSYDCFKLDTDEKGDNAQNYAWLTGEAYWSKKCDKTFKDPEEGVKNNEDFEDMNDFFTSEPTSSPDPVPAPAIPGTSGNPQPVCSGSVEFHQEEAAAAVQRFCEDTRWQGTVIVPLISFGSGQMDDGRSKALGVNDHFPTNNGADNLWLEVSFSEDECIGMFTFDSGTCTERFGQVLNGCDTSGLFPKHGGQIKEVCALYRMTARPIKESDPLTLKSQDENQVGAFTCEDTKFTGDNSPLEGTCACWFTGIPTVSEIFNKPSSGKCTDVTRGTNPKSNN